MPRLRFIADGDSCTVFGATFRKNRWTPTLGLTDDQVAVLAANPTFEFAATDQDVAPPPSRAPAGRRVSTSAAD